MRPAAADNDAAKAVWSKAIFFSCVAASAIIRAQTGVVIDPMKVHPVMLIAPGGIIFLAGLLGIFPAIKAYRTDVAGGLSPIS